MTENPEEREGLVEEREDIDFESFENPPRSRWKPWAAAAVVAALVLAGLYVLKFTGEEGVPAPAEKPRPGGYESRLPGADAGLPAAPEEIAPGTPAAVPSLGESDNFVREWAEVLAGRPLPRGWMAAEDLIGRFVAAVDNIAEGHSPRGHLPFLKVEGSFTVLGGGNKVSLDPRSYRRYDAVAAFLAGLDARKSADLYRSLGPLFREAYGDLGYPHRSFDDTMKKALGRLLEVPVVEGEIVLLKGDRAYHFEDPALEGLSPAAKHLVRMGPANTVRIQDFLRRLAAALDFSL